MQFHWKKYSDKRYLTAIQVLRDLQEEGMITAIGLCNFDTIRTEEICARFGKGSIVSNQVQVT
jgi:diketogulonate reductase-like aldo/keto reductase